MPHLSRPFHALLFTHHLRSVGERENMINKGHCDIKLLGRRFEFQKQKEIHFLDHFPNHYTSFLGSRKLLKADIILFARRGKGREKIGIKMTRIIASHRRLNV